MINQSSLDKQRPIKMPLLNSARIYRPMKSFHHHLGCQMNEHDTERMTGISARAAPCT
jgi:hypothetical protein